MTVASEILKYITLRVTLTLVFIDSTVCQEFTFDVYFYS